MLPRKKRAGEGLSQSAPPTPRWTWPLDSQTHRIRPGLPLSCTDPQ